MLLLARSVSRSVGERLQAGPIARIGSVWAVFDHACDLITPDGEVIALVLPQVGDGPLNIVVESGPLEAIEPGVVASLAGSRLRVGGLEVALAGARVWEPCPDWDRLRARGQVLSARLPLVRALALSHAPPGSLLSSEGGRAVLAGVRDLAAGWQGDWRRLQAGAAQLAGRGGGLTPAGDDFLAGVMLGAWLAHPAPRRFCRLLLETAAPRTTTLAAALLRAAARGECSAPWHRLLDALAERPESRLEEAVRDLLSYGHTSGADALAGFLWWPEFKEERRIGHGF